MLECSIAISIQEEDEIPASPFGPLHDEARNLGTPNFICNLTRNADNSGQLIFEVYDDRIICQRGKKVCVLTLDEQVAFDYSFVEKKIWFTQRENGKKETFICQNQTELKSLVVHLQTRCPQSNFYKFYELLDKKGNGKNSHVWTTKRKFDKKIFAVKIQQQTSNFKEQIEILRMLEHPNIIHFKEYFISPDHETYIIMDYEDGGSLLDVINTEQQLSPKEKIKIITDMLNALQFLRIKGIVHRDLKPQNILYNTKDGNYKIADFGISRRVGEKLEKLAGTPGYIAPQLFKAKSELVANFSSDIYSMGLIIYQMLTGKRYYSGQTTEQILQNNIQKISLKKKENVGFEINHLQYSLLQKMIRTQPQNRKNSCQILTSELFRKVNKLYGLQYISSTGSPSKKSSSGGEQELVEDGIVDSFWKMIRIRSWSG